MWLLKASRDSELSTFGRVIERFRRQYSAEIDQFMFYINACRIVVMLRDDTAVTLVFIVLYIVFSRLV